LRRYLDEPVAMLAMKVTRRVLAEIISWSVGHDDGVADCGVYEYCVMPDDVKICFRVAASALTPFTKRIVTTSFGFASIQVLTSLSQFSTEPASYRLQVV
jgi:hypothetical protein